MFSEIFIQKWCNLYHITAYVHTSPFYSYYTIFIVKKSLHKNEEIYLSMLLNYYSLKQLQLPA